jgi:asparagine synthase (glutamine-hydrolysing)
VGFDASTSPAERLPASAAVDLVIRPLVKQALEVGQRRDGEARAPDSGPAPSRRASDGTEHEELVLDPTASQGALERIIWHHGEPFADPSCLPTFAVSRLARARVTVALSGDGGDELFIGYERYRGTRLEERIRSAPAPLRALARSRHLIHALGRHPSTRAFAGALSHARHGAELPDADLYLTRLEQVTTPRKAELLTGDFLRALGGHDSRDLVREKIARSPGETLAERCAHADVETYLPDDILVKVDVASMACALETRAPLLDHVLAEQVARLPFRLKMRRLETKVALREVVRHRLPPSTLARPKMGFGVPLEHWFRGSFGSALEERLLSSRARERGIVRPEVVGRLLDEHRRGEGRQNELFTLLMLETWFQVWIDPARAPSTSATAGVPVG